MHVGEHMDHLRTLLMRTRSTPYRTGWCVPSGPEIAGTRFTGRLTEDSVVGSVPAVVPTVTGRAWTTGTAQHFLDPNDPFPGGCLL